MYEQQKDTPNARSAYSQAAQWYEDENAPALANKINLKAAQFSALEGDYLDAVQRFEYVAKQAQMNNLMKFSLKYYLLNAGICHLALDIVGAKRALEHYREIDPQFPTTPQYKFFADLTELVEQGDSEAFVDRLKAWEETGNTVEVWHWAVWRRLAPYPMF